MDCTITLSNGLDQFCLGALRLYQYDPHVNETISQKPVHEGPLWGEHVGISSLALDFPFLGRKGRTILTRRFLVETCRVRWRIVFTWLVQEYELR